MSTKKLISWVLAVFLILGIGVQFGRGNAPLPALPDTRPALSVEVVEPESREIAITMSAGGSIAAWQEAIIGAELAGLRLVDVRAQVGDSVRKGQVLALLDQERVNADVAQSRAQLAEAEAALTEARLNGDRARKVSGTGAMSGQQVAQYLTAEKTAEARVQLAKAQLDVQLLRLRRTQILASDDGIVSARSATLGAVPGEGQELFRLIRQNRLEWRAEVMAAELAALKPGLKVAVEVPGAAAAEGRVRTIGPSLDAQSRNALVYVDLPDGARAGLRPGMFARGSFRLGESRALTVPRTALALREGFNYVFRLDNQTGQQARVSQVKVMPGRSDGDHLEIREGLNAGDRLVASGVSFLADGDTVRVVPR